MSNRSSTDVEPRTPPPRFKEPRRQHSNVKSSLQQKMMAKADLISILRCSSENDYLWRKCRRPLRRTARKRCEFDRLSPFFRWQLQNQKPSFIFPINFPFAIFYWLNNQELNIDLGYPIVIPFQFSGEGCSLIILVGLHQFDVVCFDCWAKALVFVVCHNLAAFPSKLV